MKQPHYLFRAAALVSSVLLVGGFVSYRAGAFDWFMATNAEVADSGSSPTRGDNPSGTTAKPTPRLLPDSKVGVQFEEFSESVKRGPQPPATSQPTPSAGRHESFVTAGEQAYEDFLKGILESPPAAPTKQTAPILMGGTKSAMPSIYVGPPAPRWWTPVATPSTPPQTPQAAPAKPAPTIIGGSKSMSPMIRIERIGPPANTFTPTANPPAPSQTPQPAPAKPAPTIMGGTKYAPVFVSPTLQWAVPNSALNGPPQIPPSVTKQPTQESPR